jgi:hypothetical protein
MRHALLRFAFSALLLVARSAHAGGPADVRTPDRTEGADAHTDVPPPADDAARHQIDRTWLYADDARLAAPMTVTATTSLSYTSVANSPSRLIDPFPGCPAPCNPYNSFAANTATPGAMLQVGGELGLLPRLSVVAVGQVGVGGSDSMPSPDVGALVGLRLQLLPSSWQMVHLVLSGGYLREAWQGPVHGDDDGWKPGSPNGDHGGWTQLAFSADFRGLRIATTVHGEHVFSAGRDPVDVMVQAGVSYRVVGAFRAGVEYVGQDLEEAFVDGAERGARHFVGPTASLQMQDNRLVIVAGPSIGLSAQSPDVLGRIAASYSF